MEVPILKQGPFLIASIQSALTDADLSQLREALIQKVGGFRSRVLGIGPQVGYIFPIGDNQAFLGLKGYGEFDAANRPSGWNTWLTFSISEAAPKAVTPTRRMVTK